MDLEISQDQVTTITGILGSLTPVEAGSSVTFTQAQIDAVSAVLAIMQANLEAALPAATS